MTATVDTKVANRIPLVDLAAQYEAIGDDVQTAIGAVLSRGDFILGEAVRLFEEEFAAYCGSGHAIGVASGTEALQLILRGLDIGPGDEVITVANTFIATVMAIARTGATPVLVDCDPNTYLMDMAAVERAVTLRTKAVIPVHLYGRMMDLAPLVHLAGTHKFHIVEDACQAHGAVLAGRRAATIGIAGAFSFYPGKNLGAYGDAGAIVTSDAALADRLRMMRNWGTRKKYHHLIKGYNSRLDTIQAAVLRVKLRHLDEWNAARRAHARLYDELLADAARVRRPQLDDAAEPQHVFHLYVVRVPDRERVIAELKAQGIETGIHYPVPVHLQPANQDLGYPSGAFPHTEALAADILSLPMCAELTPAQITYIAAALKAAVA